MKRIGYTVSVYDAIKCRKRLAIKRVRIKSTDSLPPQCFISERLKFTFFRYLMRV